MVFSRFKFVGAAFLTVALTALVLVGPSSAWADPVCPVTRLEGRVELVDLSDQINPKIVINLARPVGAVAAGSRVTATAAFTAGTNGCIDWTREENRALATVLALKAGQMVEAIVLVPGDNQTSLSAGGVVPLARINPLQSPNPWAVAGEGKLKQEELLTRAEQGPVKVMVVLAGHGRLAAQLADPEEKPRALAEIKELQDRLLADVPADQFTVSNRLTNVAVLSGQATLAGLKSLIAHDLVTSIEPDVKVRASRPLKMQIKEKKQ